MCISTVASNLTLLVLIANSNASFTWYSLSFLISSADLRKFLPRLSRRVLAGFCITFLFSVVSSCLAWAFLSSFSRFSSSSLIALALRLPALAKTISGVLSVVCSPLSVIGCSLTFVTFFDTVFFLVVTGFLLTATLLSALFSTPSSLLLALGFRLLVFSVIVTPFTRP